MFLYSEWKVPRAGISRAEGSLTCCDAPGKLQCISSPAMLFFIPLLYIFISFIDRWIHLTKYKHPVMTHFMYILFSLIFTSSFMFLFSMYLLFNLHIFVFFSQHISLSFLTSITFGYFSLVLIFVFAFCLLTFVDIDFPTFMTFGHKFSNSVSLAYHQSNWQFVLIINAYSKSPNIF